MPNENPQSPTQDLHHSTTIFTATFPRPLSLTNIGCCQSPLQRFISQLLRALHELERQDVVGKVEGNHLSCTVGTLQHILRIQVILKETWGDHITCGQMYRSTLLLHFTGL